jgi:hypothetical protein
MATTVGVAHRSEKRLHGELLAFAGAGLSGVLGSGGAVVAGVLVSIAWFVTLTSQRRVRFPIVYVAVSGLTAVSIAPRLMWLVLFAWVVVQIGDRLSFTVGLGSAALLQVFLSLGGVVPAEVATISPILVLGLSWVILVSRADDRPRVLTAIVCDLIVSVIVAMTFLPV